MSDIVERLRSHDDCLLQPIRRDVKEAADEIERQRAEIERLREALKPFAALFLWPDDAGDEWTVNDIRSDEDWSDLKNHATLDDKWVYRGDIRAARNALEGKI